MWGGKEWDRLRSRSCWASPHLSYLPVDAPPPPVRTGTASGVLMSHPRACMTLATNTLSLPWDPGGRGDGGCGEGAGGSGAGCRPPCPPLVFSLEPCAQPASLLQSTPICQMERTPAPGQPGWEHELHGEECLIGGRLRGCSFCCDPVLAVCHCLGDSAEKGLLSFSAALDWQGRQHMCRW